jgi:hypothetical protein
MIKQVLLVLAFSLIFQGCNNHPRDKTNLDDILYCGFGQEYVDGYTTSKGKKVDGYCRKSN